MTHKEFFLWFSGYMQAKPRKIDLDLLLEKIKSVQEVEVRVQFHHPTAGQAMDKWNPVSCGSSSTAQPQDTGTR